MQTLVKAKQFLPLAFEEVRSRSSAAYLSIK